MNFIFAKLFEDYKKKLSNPEHFITKYITFVYLCYTTVILIPVLVFLDHTFFKENFKIAGYSFAISIAIIFFLISKNVERIYIKKKRIHKLKKRFKHIKIHKIILYPLAIFIPLIIIFLFPLEIIFLKGGSILNHEIIGILK